MNHPNIVTMNILQRVFHISYGNGTGTCFAIDVDGKQYLVTARHIVPSIGDSDVVQIFHDGKWKVLSVRLVGHAPGEVDITVLAPAIQISSHPVVINQGLYYSQDVFFLGFPYGFTHGHEGVLDNYPIPFIKKATVSSMGDRKNDDAIYLDGHNNPGFSGGPVVHVDTKTGDMVIAGVISGYVETQEPVYDAQSQAVLNYGYNTGIIRAYLVGYAIKLIRANPIGVELDPNPTP